LFFEKRLWKENFIVVGVDEVGRGALAGPITVGAVCFEPTSSLEAMKRLEKIGINDSKKIAPKKRIVLAKIIKQIALAYDTISLSNFEINRLGLVKVNEKAVRQVVAKIEKKLNIGQKLYLLTDAFSIKYIKRVGLKNQKAIIHGDCVSLSIAAASIIAKVERDSLMIKMNQRYSYYQWFKNKGYGTKNHIEAIKKYGPSRFHRNLFLRKIIEGN